MIKRLKLNIYGLVQGVGYRNLTQIEAKRRNFAGWVANLPDGSVEIVAEGIPQDLQGFISWCYNAISAARVHRIEENWSEATGEFYDFVIRF